MGRHYQGGESARFMMRIPPDLREAWEQEAEGADLKLGPWIRLMVETGRATITYHAKQTQKRKGTK